MDRMERRLIQLKIQREALKKAKDAESKQRLADLESEIDTLERQFSDLEEVWKAEKASLTGATKIKEHIEQLKIELVAANRNLALTRSSVLKSGQSPEPTRLLHAQQDPEPPVLSLFLA